jgi:hypothetical protein
MIRGICFVTNYRNYFMFGYLPITLSGESEDLENALFSMSDSLLRSKFLVKVLKRMAGPVMVCVPKPSQFIHAFDLSFPTS